MGLLYHRILGQTELLLINTSYLLYMFAHASPFYFHMLVIRHLMTISEICEKLNPCKYNHGTIYIIIIKKPAMIQYLWSYASSQIIRRFLYK